jgi:transposase
MKGNLCSTLTVKNYLTDAQWERIRSFIVLPTGGRPKTTDLRSIIHAILYHIKTGCQWRMLPHDFAPEGTVHDYFHNFKRNKLLKNTTKLFVKKWELKKDETKSQVWQ